MMNISLNRIMCDTLRMNTPATRRALWLFAAVGLTAGKLVLAQPTGATNAPAAAQTEAPSAKRSDDASAPAPQKLDEAAFRIIAERNIFNANRSGGRVQLATRRPARIETVTLVGTMAYERGTFAFFDGSSSEFSKVIQANGVIAGHKLVNVRTAGVTLEADGKQFELPVGSQLRREDAGAWLVTEATGSSAGSSGAALARTEERSSDSGRNGRTSRNDSGRSRRSDSGGESGARPATPAPAPAATPTQPSEAEKNDILKRLQERREKE